MLCLHRTRQFFATFQWVLRVAWNELFQFFNFLHDEIVHALQNTIDSCINYATDRRCYVLEHTFSKFSEGHSRSPILVPIESSYTTSY